MIYTFPITIIALILLMYLSIQTYIIPLALGYLIVLYGLKDLAPSKHKKLLALLSTLGLMISLLPYDTLIVQEILLFLMMIILTMKIEKKFINTTPSTFFMLLIFAVSQISSNFYVWVVGWLGLVISSYYFYIYTSLYLEDHPQPTHMIYRPLPKVLKIMLIIITIFGSLYGFNEFHFQTHQTTFAAYEYRLEENEYGIQLLYPYYFSSDIGNVHANISPRFILPEKYGSYQQLSIDIGYPKSTGLGNAVYLDEIASYVYFRKEIPTGNFKITDYYELNNGYNTDLTQNQFTNNRPLTLLIYFDNNPESGYEKVRLEFTKKDRFVEGKNLLVHVYGTTYPPTDVFNQYELTLTVDYSIFLSPILSKTENVNYELYAIEKETNVEKLLDKESNNPEKLKDEYIYFNLDEDLDESTYDYYLYIKVLNEKSEVIFDTKVVIHP